MALVASLGVVGCQNAPAALEPTAPEGRLAASRTATADARLARPPAQRTPTRPVAATATPVATLAPRPTAPPTLAASRAGAAAPAMRASASPAAAGAGSTPAVSVPRTLGQQFWESVLNGAPGAAVQLLPPERASASVVARIERLAKALATCGQSQKTFSLQQPVGAPSYVQVRFTPACGNLAAFSPDDVGMRITACTIMLDQRNGQWALLEGTTNCV